MTVARLERELSEREFQEWLIYEQLEPWGEPVADARHGILAALIANISRAWGGGEGEPYTPSDFIPHYAVQDDADAEEGDETDEDAMDRAIVAQQAFFEQMTLAAGGRVE